MAKRINVTDTNRILMLIKLYSKWMMSRLFGSTGVWEILYPNGHV